MIPTGMPTHGITKRKMMPTMMSATPTPIMVDAFPAAEGANP